MPANHIQGLITLVQLARSRFLYGLDHTPDDRLDWTSGEAGTTPLQLAAKVVEALNFVRNNMATGEVPDQKAMQPEPFTTREEAKEAMARAYDEFLAYLDGLTEPDLGRTIKAPLGEITTGALLWWVPQSLGYFQGQLNFAQLTYGDRDYHIPPDWFPDKMEDGR